MENKVNKPKLRITTETAFHDKIKRKEEQKRNKKKKEKGEKTPKEM